MLAGIDTLTMESAVKEGAIDFTFKGRGADAEGEGVGGGAGQGYIQGFCRWQREVAPESDGAARVLDMVLSLKVEARNEAVLGELKKSILQYMFLKWGRRYCPSWMYRRMMPARRLEICRRILLATRDSVTMT